jgi:flagellar hook protein FlgE
MNAGISGLQANSNRLASISDNIANSATLGYRRANTSFHSLVIGDGLAGQASYTAGGVRSTTSRLIEQGGGLIGTQNATDLAISGRGFLPVTNTTGAQLTDGTAPLFLTSTGSFRQDAKGVMRDPAGNVLMGWPFAPNGALPSFPRDSVSGLRPVQIDADKQISVPTGNIRLDVNLPATETLPGASGDSVLMSVDYFNGVGLSDNLTLKFTPQIVPTGPTNAWTLDISSSALNENLGRYQLIFNPGPENGGTLQEVTRIGAAGQDFDLSNGTVGFSVNGQNINLDIGRLGSAVGLTQRGANFSSVGIEQDGFGSGNLVGLMVDESGNLDAVYDQGFRRSLFRIPIVDVPNPNGLTTRDNQTFQISRESGSFFLWDAGTGPVGELNGFALQESATDVAAELTSLIQTQRAYSSNAKVIQTVDEMFQETTNIKR